jgi:Tyrosine-protein kinase ephrin type A/B receptor-like
MQYQCLLCPLGSFAYPDGQAQCTLCPLASYADSTGSSSPSCSSCPYGRTTAALGSTSSNQCISPVPNLVLGFFSVTSASVVYAFYIYGGRYQRVSFVRKERLLVTIKREGDRIIARLAEFVRYYKTHRDDSYLLFRRAYRTLIFALLSCAVIILGTVGLVVLTTFRIFFSSLIIERAYQLQVPYFDVITAIAHQIAHLLSVPFLDAFFYPFIAVFYFFANLNINFGAAAVTCAGAQAAVQLLINTLILGVVTVLIGSGYVLFQCMVIIPILTAFLSLISKKEFRHVFQLGSVSSAMYGGVSAFVLLAAKLNPLQSILRYVMTFILIVPFFAKYGVMHNATASCDVIPGVPAIDTVLAVLSSIVMWLLLVPSLYMISKLLIPRLPSWANREILQQIIEENDDRCYAAVAADISSALETSPDSDNAIYPGNAGGTNVDAAVGSLGIGAVDHDLEVELTDPTHFDARYYDLGADTPPTVHVSPNDSNNNSNQHYINVLKTIGMRAYKSVLAFVAPDLWIAFFAFSWTRRIYAMTAYSVLLKRAVPDDEEAPLPEEIINTPDAYESHEYGQLWDRVIGLASWRKSASGTPGRSGQKASDVNEPHVGQKDENERQLWMTHRQATLPSYMHLCHSELKELRHILGVSGDPPPYLGLSFAPDGDRTYWPRMLSYWSHRILCAACVSVNLGHLFTRVGRNVFDVVIWNYILFLMVSLGIWNEETCVLFDIEGVVKENRVLDPYDDTFTSSQQQVTTADRAHRREHVGGGHDNETNTNASEHAIDDGSREAAAASDASQNKAREAHNELQDKKLANNVVLLALSCSVIPRAILYQIIPFFTIFSVYVVLTATAPIFVLSSKLKERLPALFITNAYAVGRYREYIQGELQDCVVYQTPVTIGIIYEDVAMPSKKVDQVWRKPIIAQYEWIYTLRMINIFVMESRAIMWFLGLYQFIICIGLLFSPSNSWAYWIVVVYVPVGIANSLTAVVELGKWLNLTDDDLYYLTYWPKRLWGLSIPQPVTGEFPIFDVDNRNNVLGGSSSSSSNPFREDGNYDEEDSDETEILRLYGMGTCRAHDGGARNTASASATAAWSAGADASAAGGLAGRRGGDMTNEVEVASFDDDREMELSDLYNFRSFNDDDCDIVHHGENQLRWRARGNPIPTCKSADADASITGISKDSEEDFGVVGGFVVREGGLTQDDIGMCPVPDPDAALVSAENDGALPSDADDWVPRRWTE